MDDPSPVYFTPLSENETDATLVEKTKTLAHHLGLSSLLNRETLVAIKQHFGEKGNENFLTPVVAKCFVEMVKEQGAWPLLVETNTLYKGDRADSYHHLLRAYKHGFSIANTGAPVIIMDGVNGQNQSPVSIPGSHFKKVYMVPDLPFFDTLVVLSHVKGHMMAGMGGAIKNLAMGFTSRAGKLAQHDDFKPLVNEEKCTGCGVCTDYCPVNANALIDNLIRVNHDKCIGCGECYIACQYDAYTFNWNEDCQKFNEKMAEYALGAVINHKRKAIYFNFFNKISRHCDCWDENNPVIYKDIGVFASFDPVAIDQACYDKSNNIFKEMWPQLDATVQIKHGHDIGLGNKNYSLKVIT